MSETRVRILVVQPRPAPGVANLGISEALGRLGSDARIEVRHDPEAVREGIRSEELDLVVLDSDLGPGLEALLGELRLAGPPAIVVSAEAGEGAALRAFRAGAADCVTAGADLAEVLPVAALEQIRRWREQRRRSSERDLARRVDELERTNEHIIQNMNSVLLVLDAEGKVTFANRTAERILDAEPGSLRGRPVWDWIPESLREESHLARTLSEGRRFRGAEGMLQRPDGSLLPVGISCAPLAATDAGPPGAVAIFQDLSEIKQLQRQVLQTEKMASIGQLAAGVAHEINNPMGFVHANLSQMAEYLDDLGRVWERVEALAKAVRGGGAAREELEGLDRVVEEVDADFLLGDFAKAIRESLEGAERVRHIVQDLRAFSHQGLEERSEADINQCLDSTANIVWTMMKHHVVLTKEYRELPPARCRPMQLKQVFMNLLINAYQAIEARGEGVHGEIRLQTERWAGGVRIRVEDNGTGIEPAHLDRIFDPFFTTKEVGVGMGLGLSTCFNIVRQHGGSLHAESEPGRGTCFEVQLPLDGRPREEDEARG